MPLSVRSASTSSCRSAASDSLTTSSRGAGESAPCHGTDRAVSASTKVRSKPVIAALVRAGESGEADTLPRVTSFALGKPGPRPARDRASRVTPDAAQTATAAPQIPQASKLRRFHRAIGMKKTENCEYSRIRAHWVVLWQRGHARV